SPRAIRARRNAGAADRRCVREKVRWIAACSRVRFRARTFRRGFDSPRAQSHYAVAAGGERGIVGDEDQRGAALRVAPEQKIDDLGSSSLVEVAGGLVGDEDGRVWRQRAGERYALLLAAGKLGRIVLPALAQTHGGKLACGALVGVSEPGQLQRHGDVFK